MYKNFEQFLKANPESKFSDYYVCKLKEVIKTSRAHNSLGKNLGSNNVPADFEEAGRLEFDRYLKWFDLHPNHKVVDFGCGSLRLGLHFIRFLSPNNYFGIDLTNDFIKFGSQMTNEILGEGGWKANLGTIKNRFDDAVAHNANFVFSSNVAYHVHPDECEDYFEQLTQLAGRSDSKLCFDARVANSKIKFGDRNFAFPFDFFNTSLPEFKLVRTFPDQKKFPPWLRSER